MRNIEDSSKTSCKVASSCRALARSRPNGFSTITRASSAQPEAFSPCATLANMLGGQFAEALFVVAAAIFHAVARPLLELVQVPPAARDADDGNIQPAATNHGVERGKNLFVRQVAGGAEEDEGVGLRFIHGPLDLSCRRSCAISSINSTANATPARFSSRSRSRRTARRARRRASPLKCHSLLTSMTLSTPSSTNSTICLSSTEHIRLKSWRL